MASLVVPFITTNILQSTKIPPMSKILILIQSQKTALPFQKRLKNNIYIMVRCHHSQARVWALARHPKIKPRNFNHRKIQVQTRLQPHQRNKVLMTMHLVYNSGESGKENIVQKIIMGFTVLFVPEKAIQPNEHCSDIINKCMSWYVLNAEFVSPKRTCWSNTGKRTMNSGVFLAPKFTQRVGH